MSRWTGGGVGGTIGGSGLGGGRGVGEERGRASDDGGGAVRAPGGR